MEGCRGGMTRRQFLKASAAGAAFGIAGRSLVSYAVGEYDLAVISGEPVTATRNALEAIGGISRFVKKGQRVVLKPNMSFARTPDFSATTHPLVVAAVAQACMEAGAQQVLVLDHTLQRAEVCLERAGIREACKNMSGVHVLAVKDKLLRLIFLRGEHHRNAHHPAVGDHFAPAGELARPWQVECHLCGSARRAVFRGGTGFRRADRDQVPGEHFLRFHLLLRGTG